VSRPPARITLNGLTRLIMALVPKIAASRRWGTLRVVFQDGQIRTVSFDESWDSDAAIEGPVAREEQERASKLPT